MCVAVRRTVALFSIRFTHKFSQRRGDHATALAAFIEWRLAPHSDTIFDGIISSVQSPFS
jgi:hypothetical protein